MEELLKIIAEEAKKDKSVFLAIRNMAVRMNKSQVVVELDKMREDLFPLKKEEKEAKKLDTLFRMVDIRMEEPTAWLVFETVKRYQTKGASFSLKDASSLIAEQKEIFGT